MGFKEKLREYRQAKAISKTEVSRQMKLSLTYISMLEIGARKPPSIERIEQISKILSLTREEKNNLINLAADERLPQKEKDVFRKSITQKESNLKSTLSHEIIEALQDPIAVKALLVTHQNSEDIKNTIKHMLDCLPSLSPEKRQAILALCK